jgi:tetratricopeptide (TPR) repeat protein
VAVAIGLVAVPLLWTEVPAEIARWYLAAAVEAQLDGDDTKALRQADRAIEWCDRSPELYAARASLELKLHDLDGALADADRAVALAPGAIRALSQRVLVYQRRGEHERALMDVEKLVEVVRDQPTASFATAMASDMAYEDALNLRAYSRALAGREIKQGLADIEQAFLRAGTENNPAYLDTRGFLRYLDGDFAGAESDLQRAVQLAEALLQAFRAQGASGDPRVRRDQERQLTEVLAVVLHHRGLVHEAFHRPEEAADDFRRAQQYGYSPEDGVW